MLLLPSVMFNNMKVVPYLRLDIGNSFRAFVRPSGRLRGWWDWRHQWHFKSKLVWKHVKYFFSYAWLLSTTFKIFFCLIFLLLDALYELPLLDLLMFNSSIWPNSPTLQDIRHYYTKLHPKWHWKLQGQRYLIYAEVLPVSPKFHSVSLYDHSGTNGELEISEKESLKLRTQHFKNQQSRFVRNIVTLGWKFMTNLKTLGCAL